MITNEQAKIILDSPHVSARVIGSKFYEIPKNAPMRKHTEAGNQLKRRTKFSPPELKELHRIIEAELTEIGIDSNFFIHSTV